MEFSNIARYYYYISGVLVGPDCAYHLYAIMDFKDSDENQSLLQLEPEE